MNPETISSCAMKPMEPMKPMTPMKPMAPMQPMKPSEAWWPRTLGDSPNNSGGQNDFRYAYFSRSNRLALQTGNEQVRVYDTTGYAISDAHQEQGTGQSGIVLSTDDGEVNLSKLSEVSEAK